jgi:transcriptional regulator with XRE-family HTH domain
MMHVRRLIAERIKHRLRVLNISRKEFARIMGTQPPRVTTWLSGEHNFTIGTLAEIEVALKFRIFIRHTNDDEQNACFPCVIGDELFVK